jgi:hypothetical protein
MSGFIPVRVVSVLAVLLLIFSFSVVTGKVRFRSRLFFDGSGFGDGHM